MLWLRVEIKEGKYDLFQLESFVKKLKSLYIKAYEQLQRNNE